MLPCAVISNRLVLTGVVAGAAATCYNNATKQKQGKSTDWRYSRCEPGSDPQTASSYDYVVAGGGAAALAALQELVRNGRSSDTILLVSPSLKKDGATSKMVAELHPFLTSPGGVGLGALVPEQGPKFSIEFIRSALLPTKTSTDGRPSVEVLLGRSVERIHSALKTALLDDSTSIGYGKILLATGGDSRDAEKAISQRCVAPDAMQFVCFGDESTDKVEKLLASVRGATLGSSPKHAVDVEPPHATVVGGSWASATLGASLLARGVCVTMTFAEPHFLARHLPKFASTDIVRRVKFLAREVDASVDTLSYSALKYIACSEVPPEYRRHLSPDEVETEATVHMSLVFDAFDLVQFRSDLVIFAPTSLPFATSILPTVRTDDVGKLVSTPELSVASDVFAAGACLADSVDSPATWSTRRATATGAHAARNMLGSREPFPSGIPAFEVDLSPLDLKLHCIGMQDGNCETRGFFLVSRDQNSTTCGGNLVDGVLFYLSPVRQDRCEVLGICVWSSDGRIDGEAAVLHAEEFLTNRDGSGKGGVDRRELSVTMDSFAKKILGLPSDSTKAVEDEADEDEADEAKADEAGLGERKDDQSTSNMPMHATTYQGERPPTAGLKYVRFHRAARNASSAVPAKEVMSIGDLGSVVSSSSTKDRRARAYDTLIRNSMNQP